ncbi:hypothetical protein E2C01_076854 [Portunus trituberculatus]|uniref:Uncharacterized protein n=1 Tax=Portunus trituberculatus TaxID=210409 RepID=A0A5B7IK59_PORTR|nr:hypothetical protein [Portunus trituberculatus]
MNHLAGAGKVPFGIPYSPKAVTVHHGEHCTKRSAGKSCGAVNKGSDALEGRSRRLAGVVGQARRAGEVSDELQVEDKANKSSSPGVVLTEEILLLASISSF